MASAAPLSDGDVVLRLPNDRDIEAIAAYGQNPEIEESGWLPIPVCCPREVAARTVQEFLRGWHGRGRFGRTFVIAPAAAPDLLGVVHLVSKGNSTGEIAYGVAPEHRRQGLATRAVCLVTTWAFADLGLTRLEICVTARGVHGIASQRVAEKAGFVYEGIRRSRLPMTGVEVEDRLYVLMAPPRTTPDDSPPHILLP